jgi:hypothetical protein
MLKGRVQFTRSCSNLLTVEETAKALLECGVSRAANLAQISTGSFLINKYATNRPTKQRDLFQAT